MYRYQQFFVEYGPSWNNTHTDYISYNPNDSNNNEESKTRWSTYYFKLNTLAVFCHLINAICIGAVYEARLKHIKTGYAFVSPVVPLRWTNHALVLADSTESKCKDVANSPNFKATLPLRGADTVGFAPRLPFSDFMTIFNFSNTDIIEYNKVGSELNLDMMMLSFCILSAMFQTMHGLLLYANHDIPRFLHYLEYAFSSPLMVMVMAVEVGIVELFVVTSLGGLFFGMNIVGMCAEIMTHYAWKIADPVFSGLCYAVHFAGWVLFAMAMIPIWAQFHQVLTCSENGGTPDYVYALIIVESIMFFLFGFLQVATTIEKLSYSKEKSKNFTEMLFKYDCMHAMLSLVAKTTLAWLLLGPALSVNIDNLTNRGGL